MKKRIIYIAVLSVLLAACGGGKDDKASQPNPLDNNSGGNNTDTTTSSKITLDDTVPDATRTKIVEIVSPLGETSATGGTVATADQRSTVMALDKDGQIIMLGFASGNTQTTLNAESTAVGMVHLLWSQNSDLTDIELENQIKATAGFNTLVASIEQAFQAGQLVSDNAAVLKQAIIVTNQLAENINTTVTIQARYLPTTPSIENPLPFDVIKPSSSFFGKVNIDQTFKVVNTLPIVWDMRSLDYDGKALGNEDQRLPAASLGNRISTWFDIDGYTTLGVLSDYVLGVKLGTEAAVIANHDDQTFQFQIFQSDYSRRANVAEIAADTVLNLLNVVIDKKSSDQAKCRAVLVKTFTDSSGFGVLASSKNSDEFLNNFKKLGNSVLWRTLMTANGHSLGSCLIEGKTTDIIGSTAKMIGAKTNMVYNAYKLGLTGVKFAGLFEKVAVMGRYNSWGIDNPLDPALTVCIGKDKQIQNCATKLVFDKVKPITTPVGETLSLEDNQFFKLEAFDRHGTPTLLPNSLTYESNKPDAVRVLHDNKLFFLSAEAADITVVDQATGIRSNAVSVKAGSNGYVKISATGEQLPNSATDWDCVLDKETGLMWEKKTDDGGLRDYRHRYSWFENGFGFADPKDYTADYAQNLSYGEECGYTLAKCNTKVFIQNVNNQNLCGYSNWRLPTMEEFLKIGVKQDKEIFFGTVAAHWSSSYYIGDSTFQIPYVASSSFGYMTLGFYSFNVWAVRSGQ